MSMGSPSLVSGRCNCCRRPWDVCFPSTQSWSPSEFVCHDCKPHQGFTLRSDPEHIKLWQAYLAAREREHDGAVSQLNERIADLERELREDSRTLARDRRNRSCAGRSAARVPLPSECLASALRNPAAPSRGQRRE